MWAEFTQHSTMTTIPSEINPAAIKGVAAEKHTPMCIGTFSYERAEQL
jgi:hypothetical protein